MIAGRDPYLPRGSSRLAQGAAAAMMVPQVLATLHLLFSDGARSRAFGIYGIVLGLAGAAGFALGGMPLIDLDLLSDRVFMRGLCAAFFFFFANLSFYFVMTMFMQSALHIPPLQAGLVFVPLARTFVIGAVFFAIETAQLARVALLASLALFALSIATSAAFLSLKRPAAA